MSHFTVLVLGDNPEEKLAPYQENNMGDCPEEYLEFIDESDTVTESVNTVIEEGYMADNHPDWVGQRYGDLYIHELENDEEAQQKFKNRSPISIEEATKEDAVAILHHGYHIKLGPEKQYGFRANPHSKWDWYELGGRWNGNFLPKEDREGTRGPTGIFGNEGREGWVDQIRKGDVDWSRMQKIKKQKAHDQYDEYKETVTANKIFEPEHVNSLLDAYNKNEYPNKNTGTSPQDDYESVDKFMAAMRHRRAAWQAGIISVFDGPDDIPTRNEFVKDTTLFSTYAVVDQQGKWHEPGKMGWFGVSHADPEKKKEFKESFFETWIAPLEDDVLLSVYDCHV